MDTTNQTALSKAHQYLSDDLAKVSQFIQPENQQALSTLYQAQRRLEDIGELVKFDNRTNSEPLHLSDLNPLLHSHVADTAAHVRCVLLALGEIDFEAATPGDTGDLNCGIHDLLYLLERALKIHETHGDNLPDDVVLEQADWQLDLQRRAKAFPTRR